MKDSFLHHKAKSIVKIHANIKDTCSVWEQALPIAKQKLPAAMWTTLQGPVNMCIKKSSHVLTVPLETCSCNSWNAWCLLLSLEMLLKCVATSIFWNCWKCWHSWNTWNSKTILKLVRACAPNRNLSFKHSWNMLLKLLKCLALLTISWNALEMCCYLLKLLMLLKCLKLETRLEINGPYDLRNLLVKIG